MRESVGTCDSGIRLTVWVMLVELAAAGVLGPWAFLGVLPLGTGMLRKCPVYRTLHLDTAAPS